MARDFVDRNNAFEAFAFGKKPAPCMTCGSTHSCPGDTPYGICATCERKLRWRSRKWSDKIEDHDFLYFAARTLKNETNKIVRGQWNFHCEAITVRGYQCGSPAKGERDGRRVCSSHMKATKTNYIGMTQPDKYRVFTDIIRTVSRHDPLFRAAIEAGLK